MPPKASRRISAEARAETGVPRTCVECGDLKLVGDKTFATLTKAKGGHRGWHTVCRVCQSAAAVEKKWAYQGLVDAQSDDLALVVDEMYTMDMTNRKKEAEDKAVVLALEVRKLVEGGHKRAAFELFINIIKPLLPEWKEPGAIHEDIKDGLLSEHRRTLIIATRFSAKSTLTSIYVAFEIWLNPLIKILVVSKGSKLAGRMLRTVRKVYFKNCPMLRHLEPNDECLDNAEQFQTPDSIHVMTGGVTLTSVGMASNLPGYRSDLTIGDDVEGPSDDTPEKVASLEEALNELHMINPRGRKVMLGTFQSEFSVYAKLADLEDEEGTSVWETIKARMFEEDKDSDGKVMIHSRWGAMFTDADGRDWRRAATLRAWKLHVLLVADPSILHERPLKIGDLPVLQWDARARVFPVSLERTGKKLPDLPRWAAPKGDEWHECRGVGDDTTQLAEILMAVDPASGLAGRDAIGVAVLGITQGGTGIILHLEGVRANDKTTARRRVAAIGRDYRATLCIVEELADGLFGETLEADFIHLGYPMAIDKVTTGGQQKGRRIVESLGPPMGAGRLAILESIVTTDHGGEFVNQLVRISYDGRTGSSKEHDDIVDALAHAVSRSKTSLISDVAENVGAHKAAQIDRWKHVALKEGGLGVHGDNEFAHVLRADSGGQNLTEALLEEDEVVIALTARREGLQQVVDEDIRFGKAPDSTMVRRIRTMTRTLKELNDMQVF